MVNHAFQRLLRAHRRIGYQLYYHTMLTQRKITSPKRRNPDFIIIGGQRCGTASLFAYLTAHPMVHRPFKKEVNFFNKNFERGSNWYRAFFPEDIGGQETGTASWITGEATPDYLFHAQVPKRVADLLPRVKLIVLLRNPIDRAISHYKHNVRRGFEQRSLEQAVHHELTSLSADFARMSEDEGIYHDASRRRFSYLARGRYLEQLDRWIALFPPEQLLVVRSEDLFDEPVQCYLRILGFLELDPVLPARFEVHNRSEPRAGSTLSKAMQSMLQGYFEPHNRRLSDRFGEEFLWKASP